MYTYDNIMSWRAKRGHRRRKYIYGPAVDEPVCMIEAAGSYAGTYYYHFDGLGSVVALTSGNVDHMGETVQVYEYDVYGRVGATDASHPNRLMFTGREYDKETGLYYYRARSYNPQIGRFLQTDPVGYSYGMNLYAYCANRPMYAVDPSGLAWEDRNLKIVFYDGSTKTDKGVPFFDEALGDSTWDLTFDISADAAKAAHFDSTIDYMISILENLRDKCKEQLESHGYTWDQVQVEGVWIWDHAEEIGKDKLNAHRDFWKRLGTTLDNIVDDSGHAKAKQATIHSRQCYLADPIGVNGSRDNLVYAAIQSGHSVSGSEGAVVWERRGPGAPYYSEGGYYTAAPDGTVTPGPLRYLVYPSIPVGPGIVGGTPQYADPY